MSCHVCSRPPNARLGFYCPTCARNQLYALRFDHANVLLGQEAAGREIEQAVTKNTKDNTDILSAKGVRPGQVNELGSDPGPTRLSIQAIHTSSSQSEARTQAILSHAAVLKTEIKNGKEEICKRQDEIDKRRSAAVTAKYQLSDRRAVTLDNVQNSIEQTESLWNNVHNKTAETAIFLCREAANLYGLRQRTRRKNGGLINTYSIGGVNIIDLRDMNSANPSQIATSLAQLSRLLILVSHYLALRLPAEIILPQREHPSPAIYAPSASYMPRDDFSSSLSPFHSQSTSPTTSRRPSTRSFPRPRPLYVDRSLPKMAKEDPAGYALFLEGASLLAWNVSWVCCSQGLNIGTETWEEVCDIGRNLWLLLGAPPALTKAPSGRDTQPMHPSANEESTGSNNILRSRPIPTIGQYSHRTAYSFLGSAEGMEFMKTWKLPSPVKIADKLKYTLLGEMANAEWELLGEEEWDEDGAQGQDPKVVEQI